LISSAHSSIVYCCTGLSLAPKPMRSIAYTWEAGQQWRRGRRGGSSGHDKEAKGA
jgi:hypothetical protein